MRIEFVCRMEIQTVEEKFSETELINSVWPLRDSVRPLAVSVWPIDDSVRPLRVSVRPQDNSACHIWPDEAKEEKVSQQEKIFQKILILWASC